jgi:hypothetical protein
MLERTSKNELASFFDVLSSNSSDSKNILECV